MAFKKSITIFFIFIILAAPQLIWGAAGGKINGKIVDATTKQPLFGANVFLEGTSIGAATNIDGRFLISGIPPGSYNLRVSYIGYKNQTRKVKVRANITVEENFSLVAVAVKGKAVVITAQASGQNAAINQQLSSDNIVNVVSAAKIKELPDANAAESVGRLPGVYLIRSYGEGSEVSIRGLEPKYNRVMIDGVEIPASSADDRSVDLSMISSDMLSGIEIYKTVTPDMDAAVLGGTVNFQIREAQKTKNGFPEINLSAQDGYNNLEGTFSDYNFTATIGKRFFNDRLGLLATGIIERENLTGDIFGASYGLTKSDYYNPGPVQMNKLGLTYKPTDKHRYAGTLVIDYKWSTGKVDMMNIFTRSTQTTNTFGLNYNLGSSNTITYQSAQFKPIQNNITNVFDLNQNLLSFNVDARLSHAYTENINPGYWSVDFQQAGAGVGKINQKINPELIAQQGAGYAILDSTFLNGINTNSSFTRQRNITGSIDFKRDINFSDFISAKIKFGGKYRYTFRSYDYSAGNGTLLPPGNYQARAAVIAANQWMTKPPYNLNPNGYDRFPISMFFDKSLSYGKFLGGNYSLLGNPENLGVLNQLVNTVIAYQQGKQAVTASAYAANEYDNIKNDYSGNEFENAAYVMGTFNFGPQITLIAGVRYQGLRTKYKAAYIPLAYLNNTFPFPFPHKDTTVSEYHGFWLPDVSLRYKPFTWFDIRLSYTNTLSYPDFNYITPKIHIYTQSVDWNNYLLKPARSQNYDVALSLYDNNIGLLTIDPFLKQIDDFIFPTGNFGISNPNNYPPLPSYTKGYVISNNGTQINDPHRVNLWGVELEWQTHFWYLPSVLSGLVLNINYTHIFSKAKYPFTITHTGVFPTYKTTYVDTFYTDRLINQPSNIVNLSMGYDYKGFSARVSMKYQQDVFSGNNFWPTLRTYQSTYIRWDFSAKQELPWYGIEAYLDILNINGEPDITNIQGSGFPTSEQSYGLTADLGLRWQL